MSVNYQTEVTIYLNSRKPIKLFVNAKTFDESILQLSSSENHGNIAEAVAMYLLKYTMMFKHEVLAATVASAEKNFIQDLVKSYLKKSEFDAQKSLIEFQENDAF